MNERTPMIDTALVETGATIAMIIGTLAIFQWSNRAIYEIGAGIFLVGILAYLLNLGLSRVNWHVFAERTIVILMMTGILGMFQPWNIKFYEYGFYVLGLATLAFIIIAHIPSPQTD